MIGYGINIGMRVKFKNILHVSSQDIVEVDSTEEAEREARYGFANKYGQSSFYYAGILMPGETIFFADMLKYNGLTEKYVKNMPKLLDY